MANRNRTVRIVASTKNIQLAILAASAGVSIAALFKWIQSLKSKAQRHARFLKLAQPDAPRQLPSSEDGGPDCVVVLGAGVSGLALAWHLKRMAPATRVVVVESESSVGGNIQTASLGPQSAIELGPRSLRTTTDSAKVALQVGGGPYCSQVGLHSHAPPAYARSFTFWD